MISSTYETAAHFSAIPVPAMSQRPNLEDSQTGLDHIMTKLTNSIEAGNKHRYLYDHEVANYDLSLDKDGNLLGVGVDLRESFFGNAYRPRPQTLWTISPEGKTTVEAGTKFFGAALMIGHQAFRALAKNRLDPDKDADIYVTVDYPTGAFVHMKTGRPVAVAMKNANVKNVVDFFTRRFPLSRVIACLNSVGSTYNSQPKLIRSILQSGAWVTYPVFTKYEKFQCFRSFNDLCIAYGPDAAMKRLRDGMQGGH